MSVRETVERLLNQLPERRTAELLFDRLLQTQPSLERTFQRDRALLSDVLTLAAWSPLLATTTENNPDYVTWLQRERVNPRVRSCEELSESLARFALINSTLDPHVMLSRFRRRELLRTYLHDIRRTRTIVETTEELSNLADAILDYALKLARQQLDNRFGAPQATDAGGRIIPAEFCVMALGKLGSFELNYSSDIDLVFLYSENGETSAGGTDGQLTNREYFVKLGERLMRFVSAETGEGAAYRIDVRLRPHGRVSALACSLNEAIAYYQHEARDWEMQTLIRSRTSAGSTRVYGTLMDTVRDLIYRRDVSVEDALASVRTAKEAIDEQRERDEKGFNVKLGRGGIREIEFIAQALEIAHGGRDPWLRSAHTLITLGRLAERSLISKDEHSQLSDAYHFLRALEHRLQMEHGLQTHTLPNDPVRRELVARRMNFSNGDALAQFEAALSKHTEEVRAAFDRVFAVDSPTRAVGAGLVPARSGQPQGLPLHDGFTPGITSDSIVSAASLLATHVAATDESTGRVAALIRDEITSTGDPQRAAASLARIAISLEKEETPSRLSEPEARALARLCGASEMFGEMIATRPSLIHSLPVNEAQPPRTYGSELESAIDDRDSFASNLDVLRRAWSRLLIEIGAHDAANEAPLPEVNRSLTELAIASMNSALTIAEREMKRRHQDVGEFRVGVLGLGRLGSGGMDYGSDLDIVVVFDGDAPSPVHGLTHTESYVRFVELFVAALSSVTREGYLYRVDLRLRPDGQKGPLASSAQAFTNYVERRAGIWEWLAYVKLRAVAGDLEFGRAVESQVRSRIHELGHQSDANELRVETRRVRERLEKERALRPNAGISIKHGQGGMLDVYFATRYLQLRDNVPDDENDRSTAQSLKSLRDAGSLDEATFADLSVGYRYLRSVDHQARLVVGRSAALPLPQQSAFADIARRLGCAGAENLSSELAKQMSSIHRAYERVMSDKTN
jgi:[glutamine synthetase] adenylyltransferase / [glutamine synthetase]-adenylyl-L-tyrosine phosphorylase